MNLIDLVKYKSIVDQLSLQEPKLAIQALLEQFNNDLNTHNIDFDNFKNSISDRQQNIMAELDMLYQDLDQFKLKISRTIASVETPYLTTKSEKIYNEGLDDDWDYKLDRDRFKNLLYDTDTRDFFLGRVKEHVNWKYPGLQLGPRLGDITDHLVALDPLYLVDQHQDMFKVVKQLWSSQYQQRVRYYVNDEQKLNVFSIFSKPTDPLAQLPFNQLGLIVAVDYFNFRPLRLIKQYLAGMSQLLRPGGVAIFTYNNCDYPIGVDNFLNSYYTYTPGRLVKSACVEYGFKIISSFDMDNNVSWLEIKKPGERSSLKGGQSLAAIKHF